MPAINALLGFPCFAFTWRSFGCDVHVKDHAQLVRGIEMSARTTESAGMKLLDMIVELLVLDPSRIGAETPYRKHHHCPPPRRTTELTVQHHRNHANDKHSQQSRSYNVASGVVGKIADVIRDTRPQKEKVEELFAGAWCTHKIFVGARIRPTDEIRTIHV